MVDWHMFVLFDIMGDLVFGESFDSLKTGATNVSFPVSDLKHFV